ncbi:DUF1707 SHOCT-like domain-containing protein [Actinomycetospora straminea]|uniref:DUF1707 domain-containing protein n=1 Tax=Actinomycetospora straminea TaxID=663607 RepID=A0ABP9EHZ1_9PSEU|nr:DUF1707 domain-containing protein [Actinomycetospora straminea]MDD7934399.1 DUF1707 domain-containing protein [Actinomycetospora straminea]
MSAEPPEMRIGDRERRATDDRLRIALDDGVLTLVEYDERTRQCWAARTQRELDVLVADLPPGTGSAGTPATTEDRPAPVAHTPVHQRVGRAIVPIVLAGVALFVGGNLVTADDGAAVFGNRTVSVAQGQGEVEVATLFGRTEVVVPPGTVARTSGAMIFGSTRCAAACQTPPNGMTLPEVLVVADGAFGSVEVVTPAEAAQGGLRDRDDDDDD